ncbi:F-box domain-containing protein [Strongyloides ratti]|uniref:F-box domain-containing protein n=1 Tax=Strongyloides ratti TaxID=34506 RepID=A0A090LE63_STRRB|nr:F-box domain-containing protein [Strongyloides ratti]CEF65775.1 F-box domain-containing protein [Strongyloides ratti]
MSKRYIIIPNLPDIILKHIFSYLLYEDLLNCELVCKRWQNLVLKTMKKDIHEVVIEQLSNCKVQIIQQPALKRLTITCRKNSYEFIAGILRRSQNSLEKVTADLSFFTNIQNVHLLHKEGKYKYFPNTENLWIVVTNCETTDIEKLKEIEDRLFTNIHFLTFQAHVKQSQIHNISTLLLMFINRHKSVEINIELHADKAGPILAQLGELNNLKIQQLKIICTDFDRPIFPLDGLRDIMIKNKLDCERLVLRDWYLHCNGIEPLGNKCLTSIRISSSTIGNTTSFVSAIKNTKENSLLSKLEMVGLCIFSDINYLNDKAHLEFEYRINCTLNDLIVDCNDIYYIS